MATLEPGDIVVVTKLDRLGRSTRELLELIDRIGRQGDVSLDSIGRLSVLPVSRASFFGASSTRPPSPARRHARSLFMRGRSNFIAKSTSPTSFERADASTLFWVFFRE